MKAEADVLFILQYPTNVLFILRVLPLVLSLFPLPPSYLPRIQHTVLKHEQLRDQSNCRVLALILIWVGIVPEP